ncbi:rho guanine nucleotide exchange factor 12 isoform X3 [Electrophorus electricus]|uniref:rho guanine nucleotide exchange factor 12 isoform X3 n=1 Tax=Electrophorus electricus TaxID=8005 RepID=UPI0015D0A549|nr:rho guanine nucleotide exchange factor 12 isoform X3 [Electrophorus electricus]
MSDTQTPVSDRTNSILSRDHPADKRHKSDTPTVLPAHEFDSTGLVQRCIIIQRDENGFGLTVSGDNPVFVQLVREDGAAMRAGVQTGDRIIKVNGTLVTQSNHVEVVKLIKSGSYVALTVLGRPPGSPHIPLSEVNMNLGLREGHGTPSATSPHAPWPRVGDREYKPARRAPSPATARENGVDRSLKPDASQTTQAQERQDMQGTKEDNSRVPAPKLLKDNRETTKRVPLLQPQLSRAAQDGLHTVACEGSGVVDLDRAGSDGLWGSVRHAGPPGSTERQGPLYQRDSVKRTSQNCPSLKALDTSTPASHPHPAAGTASPQSASRIIGAEDDYFDSEKEQENSQCGCFQSMELLKSRPAHLAAFLHHVVSQFDPAPVLCYLYTELYKQTSSRESRRVFSDVLSFFLERGAVSHVHRIGSRGRGSAHTAPEGNLKVAVPESISSELERRRPELIPEDLHRQYIQTIQDTLLPDVHRLLEDFRQKHSMGLTAAEDELSQLDGGWAGPPGRLEQERSCAESILSKIDDVLSSLQAADEDKSVTAQYVISTYMKQLGVRCREPRSLETKRTRINFLPKIKKGSKLEKDGEEKVKKPRFNILGPPRRPSRLDAASAGRVLDGSKQRQQKQIGQSALGGYEAADSGRLRIAQGSEGSDLTTAPALIGHIADASVRDPDSGGSLSSSVQRAPEGVQAAEVLDYPPCDYLPYSLEQMDEERDADRLDEALSEDDGGSGAGAIFSDVDPPSWQQLVGREVLAGLTPHEIKRQEVINELFYTERAHTRMLKVLDTVFYQKLTRDNILPPTDIRNIFTNLEEIVQLHVTISEQMAAVRRKKDLSVVDRIGDDLLSWFGGAEEERMKRAVGTFCSNQPFALELIKQRQKKDQRFTSFMQEAESNRLCRRLQLKDIIPAEMQRLTKYPLLLENVAKYTDEAVEKDKVRKAADCCRRILNHVNQAVKEAENKQRLEDYQRRLDLSSLKQSENPLLSELKNLDLTKRKLVHEGSLTWKLNKDKTVEVYTLLLEDALVLLQKQDDRLILKCHSKNRAGTVDTQHPFSPVVKLSTVLVRSVATDNRSFFVLSMSDNGAQIYELMAQTVSEQRMWQTHISQRAEVMKAEPRGVIALPQASGERDGVEVGKLVRGSDGMSSASAPSSGKGSTGLCPIVRRRSSRARAPGPAPSLKEEERARKAIQDNGSPCLDSELLDVRDVDLTSTCRAEEALKTLAVLKQVLVTQLMSQDSGERLGRPCGGRLLRTTSLCTPAQHSSEHRPRHSQDTSTGDTGFYEDPEDSISRVHTGWCEKQKTSSEAVLCERVGENGQTGRAKAGYLCWRVVTRAVLMMTCVLVGRDLGLAHSCAADSGIGLQPSSGTSANRSSHT